jgi:hypothetical protein
VVGRDLVGEQAAAGFLPWPYQYGRAALRIATIGVSHVEIHSWTPAREPSYPEGGNFMSIIPPLVKNC